MSFKVGIADHVVEGKGFRPDDVAKVSVDHTAIEAALKPEFHQRHHGVRFPALAGEASYEIRALFSIGAISGDEAGDRRIVKGGNEYFEVGGMFFLMFRGEIKKHGLERFWDLGVGEHGFHLIDRAEANFEIGILFGR